MVGIREALRQAAFTLREAGIESADVDAALLAAHVLRVERGELMRRELLGHSMSDDEQEKFEDVVDARASRLPLQHLTGVAPFRNLELRVGPGVFVPRPETEMLVDIVIEHAPQGGRVVDLCTGSGAIALAIKQERPDLEVFAVELSPDAAAWTGQNIERANLTINLSVEDARTALSGEEGTFDVVVSNPPYVPVGMVPKEPEVAEHDPEIALYGGSEDGLLFPIQIAERASALLKPGGYLVMEHADVQGESLPAALLNKRGFESAEDVCDATGKPRTVIARREGGSRFEVPKTPAERPFRQRRTVRLVIVDDENRLLLYRDSDQGMNPPFTWWSTPGGGVDVGESLREAASRELYEETGLRANTSDFVGPLADRTVIHGYSDQVVTQEDVFFALRCASFDVQPGGLTPEEAMTMQEWRWFSADELVEETGRMWPAQMRELHEAALSGECLGLPDVEESSVPVSEGHR